MDGLRRLSAGRCTRAVDVELEELEDLAACACSLQPLQVVGVLQGIDPQRQDNKAVKAYWNCRPV